MSSRYSPLGLLSLVIVWIVWGSTYLAIRIAVRDGSGFPPYTMAAARTLCGGLALLAIAAAMRRRVKPAAAEWWLLAAPLSWSIGSSLQQRRPVQLHPVVSAGWQQLLAVAGFLLLMLASGEPGPHPSPHAWMAWGYLVVFSSLLAFTAYVVALKHLPLPVVMTYAYVNPLIALVLGWLCLGERITPWTLAGATLILAGVAGVFHEKFAPADA